MIQPLSSSLIASASNKSACTQLKSQSHPTEPFIQTLPFMVQAKPSSTWQHSSMLIDSLAPSASAHLTHSYHLHPTSLEQPKSRLSQTKQQQVQDYVQTHLGQPIRLIDLAGLLNMSQFYFCRIFQRTTGVTPYQYILQQRVQRAKMLLSQTEMSIADIALQCGFNSQSHLCRHFKHQTGVTPRKYRIIANP